MNDPRMVVILFLFLLMPLGNITNDMFHRSDGFWLNGSLAAKKWYDGVLNTILLIG